MSLKSVIRACIPSGVYRALKLRKIRKKVLGNKNGEYLQSVNISTHAVLDNTTEIADGVFVGRFACIGRHTYVQHGTEILSAKIGNFCSIGTNCHIGMFEHPIDNISTSSRLYLRLLNDKDFYNDMPAPAQIGNDVWIGSNATVKGGITVGDGAVIGAGAVVTKDVPPYAVVGGVPARVIKYRFSEEKISRLLQLAWWNWDDRKIIQNKSLFEINSDALPNINEMRK